MGTCGLLHVLHCHVKHVGATAPCQLCCPPSDPTVTATRKRFFTRPQKKRAPRPPSLPAPPTQALLTCLTASLPRSHRPTCLTRKTSFASMPRKRCLIVRHPCGFVVLEYRHANYMRQVASILRAFPSPITSHKDVKDIQGFGAKSISKVCCHCPLSQRLLLV